MKEFNKKSKTDFMRVLLFLVVCISFFKLEAQVSNEVRTKVTAFLHQKGEVTKSDSLNFKNPESFVNITCMEIIDSCKNIKLYSFNANFTHARVFFFVQQDNDLNFLDYDSISEMMLGVNKYLVGECSIPETKKIKLLEFILNSYKYKPKGIRKW